VAPPAPFGDLTEIVRYWGEVTPEAVATVYRDKGRRDVTTYGQLDETSSLVGRGLMEIGLGPAEPVAVVARNHPRTPEVYFGILKAGGCIAPINFRYTRQEIGRALAATRPRLAVVERDLDAAWDAVGDRGLTVAGVLEPDGSLVGPSIDAGRRHPVDLPDIDPSTAHMVLFTSGTTGPSKGVVQSHAAYVGQTALPVFATDGTRRDDVVLCMYALFHSSGWRTSLIAWQAGATVVVLGHAGARDVHEALTEDGVSQLMALPQTLRDVAALRASDSRPRLRLRSVNTGTEPLSANDVRSWQRAFDVAGVRIHYGGSEIGPVTVLEESGSLDAPTSVGWPWPAVSLRILEPRTATRADPGTVGEVWVRSPFVMQGYLGAPELTAEAIVDGWYRTGDLGRLDGMGRLHLVGRTSDTIRSGGESVFPGEVEDVLRQAPGVCLAVVVGTPHPRWSERPVAFLEPYPGERLDAADLAGYCRSRLAPYKCPDAFHIVESMPRVGATDKIDRVRLRAAAAGAAEPGGG
jgi:acyl-CoA synthetase (AMP-forming)/AMP-acid ligase II